MSFEYTVDKVLDAAGDTRDTTLQALKKVRDTMCTLYNNAPGRFMVDEFLVPGGLTMVRDQMNNFCRDKPLPALPPPPFSGGQCQCVSYFYDFEYSIDGGTPQTGRNSDLAPILGVTYQPAAQNPSFQDVYVQGTVCTNGVPTGISKAYKGLIRPGGYYKISNIRRADGLPDTCGNPERRYPQVPSKPPFSFDINIDINGAVEIRPVLIFAPIVFAPRLEFKPEFNVSIPIKIGDITFDFSGNKISQRIYQSNEITSIRSDISSAINTINSNTNTQNNSQTTNINNNVNSQHTTTRNSISAVTTNVNSNTNTAIANTNTAITNSTNTINSNTNTQIANSATSINNNTNASINSSVISINASINAASVNLSAEIRAVLAANLFLIRADIEAVFRLALEINSKPDCPEVPPPPSALEEEPVPPDESNRTRARLKLVVIVLTREPNKQQPGGGNGAPTKQIAGWFSWKVEGNAYTSLEPINYSRSAFWVPQTPIIGYSYTLTNRAQGFAVEYTVPIA